MKTYFKFFMPYFINQNKKKSKLTSIVYHTTQHNTIKNKFMRFQ